MDRLDLAGNDGAVRTAIVVSRAVQPVPFRIMDFLTK